MVDTVPATRVPGRIALIDDVGDLINNANPLAVSITGADVTLNVDYVDGVLNKAVSKAAPADVVEGSTNALSTDLHNQLRVKDKDIGLALGAGDDAAYADASGAESGAMVSLLKGLFIKIAGVLTISGSAAVGSAPANPPLSVSGIDGSGLKRNFLLKTTGEALVSPSSDQDPVFDHTNGTKTSVTASATILTPPTGCKYARISSDVDIVVNTAGSTAVDDGTAIKITGGIAETIPVTAAVAVKALSLSGTAAVRITPMKVRA